jgi:beta-RFAP synthase
MVEMPGVQLTMRPAAAWSAEGPLAERALGYARQFVQTLEADRVCPQHLVLEAASPEHAGLGTGTQLGLAVARALAVAFGLGELAVTDLARRVGRGARSALGVHGFARGGFLVEAGKNGSETLAPLVARLPFPEPWRLVLVLPPRGTGLHGAAEVEAFLRLGGGAAGRETTDVLCRLTLLGLLPALAEADWPAFGEALYDFNARVGEAFAPVQGGRYASPSVAEVVAFARRQRVPGVGQSSWGPTVFAVARDTDQAEDLARRVRTRFGLGTAEVLVTRGCNRGATTTVAK